MAESPRVVTVLINFRAAELTLACLDRLRSASAGVENHVLVIDNGSGPTDEERLRGADAEVVLLGANTGYCAAMNRGLARARDLGAEHLLFLNNDVEVEDGFLATLVRVLDNDPALAGVGPTVLRKDGRVWCQGAELGFTPNMNRLRGEGGVPAARSKGPQDVGYLPGACALYRVADLQSVGGLDERYFMYFEDALLGHGLAALGRRLIWLPWVRVVHDASRSSGGGRSPLRKYMTAVNSLCFLKEHFQLRLLAAFVLFDCLGLPLAFLTGGFAAGAAKTRGILDGLRGHRPTAADVERFLGSTT